jgi:hypothetical protein
VHLPEALDGLGPAWDGNENIEASGKEIKNFVLASAQFRYLLIFLACSINTLIHQSIVSYFLTSSRWIY